MAHNCQTEEDHLNVKIVITLFLYNACTLLNAKDIFVTNNYKFKIHPTGGPWWSSILGHYATALEFGGSNPALPAAFFKQTF